MKVQLDRKKLLILGLGVLLVVIVLIASCNRGKDADTAGADTQTAQDAETAGEGGENPDAGLGPVNGDAETQADGEAQDTDAGNANPAGEESAGQDSDTGADGSGTQPADDGSESDAADGAGQGDASAQAALDGEEGQQEFLAQLDSIPEGGQTDETQRRSASNSTEAGLNSIETGDYTGAISFFHTAQANGEKERPIHRGLGIAYMGLGQFDQAVEEFLQFLSMSKGKVTQEDYDVNYYLGTAYYKLGQYQDAVDTYTAILTMRPKEKQAFYLRGVAELALGDGEAAKADFDAILSMDSEDYDMRIAIYRAYADAGSPDAGTAYLQGVTDPENTTISDYDRGRIFYYLGDYKNARTYLEKAKGSSGADGILMLGRTYEQLEDYNYASSVYTNYLAENGANVEIYNQLAVCRMKDQDYEGALSALQRGLEIADGGLRQTMLYNEAILYERLGRFSEASAVIADYVAAYPDDEEAAKEFEFLKNR